MVSSTLLLAGCSAWGREQGQNDTKNSTSLHQTIGVESIITGDTQTSDMTTPERTVISGFYWKLTTGETVRATVKDIMTNYTLNRHAVVIVKVPKVTKPNYDTITLERDNKGQWVITAFVDGPYLADHTDSRGLELNMPRFSMAKSVDQKKDQTWVFEDGQHVVAIAMFPREAVDSASFEQIGLRPGVDGWIQRKDSSTALFYYDNQYLVWITGNISYDSVASLAKTVSPVTSQYFPFNSPTKRCCLPPVP